MYDGSNRKHIRQAEKRSKLEEANEVAYIRNIMSSLSGRAWMYHHLAECQIFHEPFNTMSPFATAYNCGRQSVGRRLFNDVFTYCPTEYALMVSEAQAKELADGNRNAKSTDDPALGKRSSSTDPGWYAEGSRGFDYDPNTGLVIDNSEAGDDSVGDDPAIEGAV